MRIGIIGAGRLGRSLATGWAAVGHDVMFGLRDGSPSPALAGIAEGPVDAAVGRSEVVVLAVPNDAVPRLLAPAVNLGGQVVIDCTNPSTQPPLGGTMAERAQASAAGARIYKTLNQIGADHVGAPALAGGRPTTLVAGNDPEGKAMVLRLVAELGFDAVDAGGLEAASLLESLGLLWMRLAYAQKLGRNIGFALLRG